MLYNYQKVLLVKLLELYSFYSLRSVLVLIFVIGLGFTDSTAFLVYTNFVVGGDIISILGGYFGDKLLTRRISWVIGSFISIFGYGYSYYHFNGQDIPFGLIFAGMGLGLCRCNSNVIINDYIQQEIIKDQRHNHNGIFHVVTIIALLLGFLVNGFVIKYLNPKYVFAISSGSVFIGLLLFLCLEYKLLKEEIISTFDGQLKKLLYIFGLLCVAFTFGKILLILKDNIQILILVCVCISIAYLANLSSKYATRDKQSILSLLLYVPFYLVYLSFEKQLDMGFSLFLFRSVDRNIFGYQIPAPTITGIFSIAILITSYIFYRKSVYSYFKHHSTLLIGLFCALLYFSLNYFGCSFSKAGIVDISFPMISLIFLGIADVVIVPRMYSLCRNVPENIKSTSASLMMLSHGSGFYIAGKLAKLVAIDESTINIANDSSIYQHGFLNLIVVNIVVLVAVFALTKMHYGMLLMRKWTSAGQNLC